MNYSENLKSKMPHYSAQIDAQMQSDPESVRLASDPEYARQNPGKFMNRWDPTRETTAKDYLDSGYQKIAPYVNKVNNFIGGHRDKAIHGSLGTGIGYGAGVGGAIGGLGGLAAALLSGSDNPLKQALLYGAIGSGVGAIGTGYLNRSYNNSPLLEKESSFSDLTYIQQKIMSEASFSQAEKKNIIQRVSSLPESTISELSRLLKTAFGGSVGIILSRFLNMGMLGTIGMGILGGFVGSRMHDSYTIDAMGRKKLLNK